MSIFLTNRYILGDVMKMPLEDDRFDCVLDTFGLEYVLNPHKALEEMRRYFIYKLGCVVGVAR
jgi:ubiquinone/menaquinone biosynthesis C-methylase UbiE